MQDPPGNSTLALSIARGTGWLYASRYGGKLVNLAATIVLARLLTQDDFGVAGYALVFIGFLEVLEGFGVGPALVYMKENEKSRNLGFWISVVFGVLLGIATYFAAPLAGYLFNDARAVPVTQALALIFPLVALRTVHRSIFERKLAFSSIAVPEFSKAGIKALAAIGFALFGFGAWSLIIAQVLGTLIETIVYWYLNPWRPSLKIEIHPPSLKTMLSYGSGIAGLNILGFLLSNTDYILVGRYLGAAALGTYMMGYRIPNLVISQFVRTISQVIFPVFVQMREQNQSMGKGWLTAMRYVLIFTVPAGLGLAAVAEPFVLAVLGERWRETTTVVAAISIFSLFKSMSFNIGDVYKATGRINLIFKFNLFQAMITLPAMWYVAVTYRDIAAIAWTHVAIMVLITLLQWAVACRVLSLTFLDIIRSAGAPLIAGGAMYLVVVACINATPELSVEWRLTVGILSGIATYTIMAWLILREDLLRAFKALRGQSTISIDPP